MWFFSYKNCKKCRGKLMVFVEEMVFIEIWFARRKLIALQIFVPFRKLLKSITPFLIIFSNSLNCVQFYLCLASVLVFFGVSSYIWAPPGPYVIWETTEIHWNCHLVLKILIIWALIRCKLVLQGIFLTQEKFIFLYFC